VKVSRQYYLGTVSLKQILAGINMKLSYRRGTAQRDRLVSSCYISRGMGVTKVLISRYDLQAHSRTLAMVSFEASYDVLLVFHLLHRFRYIITYFSKVKEVT